MYCHYLYTPTSTPNIDFVAPSVSESVGVSKLQKERYHQVTDTNTDDTNTDTGHDDTLNVKYCNGTLLL